MVDLDATLVTSHSDKEQARPTYKRDFGFHPLWAFADRGPDGTGEPLAVTLRAGNAGSNTAADHIDLTREAFGAATVPPPRDLPRAAGPGPGRWRRVHPAAPLGPGALGVPSPRGHRPAAGLGSTRLSTTPPAPTTRTTPGSGTGADPGTTPGAHCHTPMPQSATGDPVNTHTFSTDAP